MGLESLSTFQKLLVIAVMIVGTGLGILGYYDITETRVVNASSEHVVIRVPESYGETVSISIDGSRLTILFEARVHQGYYGANNYQIIWVETL